MCFRLTAQLCLIFCPPPPPHPQPYIFLDFLGDFRGIAQFGHIVSPSPNVKTLNKIQKIFSYLPSLFLEIHVHSETHIFFVWPYVPILPVWCNLFYNEKHHLKHRFFCLCGYFFSVFLSKYSYNIMVTKWNGLGKAIPFCAHNICYTQSLREIACPTLYLIRPGMDNGRQQPEFLSQSLCGCIKLGIKCMLYMPEAGPCTTPTRN